MFSCREHQFRLPENDNHAKLQGSAHDLALHMMSINYIAYRSGTVVP